MNFIDQLNSLDFNDIGRWPFIFRASFIALIFVLVTGGGIYYITVRDQLPLLERVKQEEQDLRLTFEQKQRKAANIDTYKIQLAKMQQSFGAMLRQLPGKTEVPSLLVDISQTGLASGLDEKLFQPSAEMRKEFYAELPIKIRLTGSYHSLGKFVSGIAALPRIVTLHDIELKPELEGSDDQLVLDVTAKTYRYLDEEDSA